MATRPADETLMGLYTWVEGSDRGSPQSELEVQGLGASPYYTWVKKSPGSASGDTIEEVMWLRDLLPLYLPNAHIATFSYLSDWFTYKRQIRTSIRQIGEQLLEEIRLSRSIRKVRGRPIVFIGHSMGGLVVKQALVIADHRPDCLDIKTSAAGVVFLGTPHQGSELADMAAFIATLKLNDPSLVKSLCPTAEGLLYLSRDFGHSYCDLPAMHFYEQVGTNYARRYLGTLAQALGKLVVSQRSAVSDGNNMLYLTTDHSGLNKFASAEDSNFRKVCKVLVMMSQDAQTSINRKPTDSSSFSRGIHLGLAPLISPDAFVGRMNELQDLHTWLLQAHQPRTQTIVSISGMGGIGKTQLSLAYVRQFAHQYTSVFWINAQTEASIQQSMADLSKVIFAGSPMAGSQATTGTTDDKAQVDMVRQWLSKEGNDQWLLVFDNYDDPQLPGLQSPTGYDIRKFFPQRSQGSILITSRSSRLTFTKQMRLRKLVDIEESIAVISQRAERDLHNDDRVQALVDRLDGLPLALATAGSYIRRTGITCRKYLEQYESMWTDLMDNDETLYEYEARTLASTWTMSLDQVRQQDQDAAELLLFLAYLNHRDIWYDLLNAGATDSLPWTLRVTKTEIHFQRTLSRLQDYNLVEVMSDSWQVHPCLHDWLIGQLDTSTDTEHYLVALTCVARTIPDERDSDTWNLGRRLLGHAECLLSPRFRNGWATCESDEATEAGMWKLLSRIADLLIVQREYDKGMELYSLVVAGQERSIGPEHRFTLTTLNNLGILYLDLFKLDEAERLFHRLLSAYERASPPDHASAFSALDALGYIYSLWDDLDQARQMYDRAVTGREKMFGKDDVSTLKSLTGVAEILIKQDKVDEAEKIYDQVLCGCERTLGPDHLTTLSAVYDLGHLYFTQDKLDKAEKMFDRALLGREAALGADHPLTLQVIGGFGNVYLGQGRLEEAETMLNRALVGYEKIFGPDHLASFQSVMNLAILYHQQQRLDEAETMCSRALAGFTKLFGPDHKDTVSALGILALVYYDQGRVSEAVELSIRHQDGLKRITENT